MTLPPKPDEERRFLRYEGRRRPNDDYDPDEEPIFAGLRTLRAWEVALFLAAMIASLSIWLVFLWIHRGFPSAG